jgi:AcrR family transcriptional regulator
MDQAEATGGLRERKKRETRAALSWAAVRLAVERGYGAVLIEDIAAAAGVSPRTFNNYFSSKAQAIVARHVDRLQGIAAGLRVRPPSDPLWDAIVAAVVEQFSGGPSDEGSPDAQWAAGVRLMLDEPSVEAEFLRESQTAEGDIAAAIGARIGAGPGALYPELAAAALGAAVQVALSRWLRPGPPTSLPQALEEAIRGVSRLIDGEPTP